MIAYRPVETDKHNVHKYFHIYIRVVYIILHTNNLSNQAVFKISE